MCTVNLDVHFYLLYVKDESMKIKHSLVKGRIYREWKWNISIFITENILLFLGDGRTVRIQLIIPTSYVNE